MITTTCRCGKVLTASDEHAGHQGKCSGCGTVVTMPFGMPETRSNEKVRNVSKLVHDAPKNVSTKLPAARREFSNAACGCLFTGGMFLGVMISVFSMIAIAAAQSDVSATLAACSLIGGLMLLFCGAILAILNSLELAFRQWVEDERFRRESKEFTDENN